VRNRSSVLELAILGLLHQAPMHGYELRKQLNAMLGPFRAFSYGTLYPGLRALTDRGLITASEQADGAAHGRSRARIVYSLTEAGNKTLEELLGEAGPASWEDEYFDVRFAFFAQTDPATRVRLLEGRLLRMNERLYTLTTAVARDRAGDPYLRELQRHSVEQVEREVRWLETLLETERNPKEQHQS
jgi:DNA-binding PadR family transcriptional regulator